MICLLPFYFVVDPAYDMHLGGHLVSYVSEHKEELEKLFQYREEQRSTLSDTIIVPIRSSNVQLFDQVFGHTSNIDLANLASLCQGLLFLECRTFFAHHFIKSVAFNGKVYSHLFLCLLF